MEAILTIRVHTDDRLQPFEMKNKLLKDMSKAGYSMSDDFAMTEIRGVKLTNGTYDRYDVDNAYNAHITSLKSIHK